jgi:hypothetical protein
MRSEDRIEQLLTRALDPGDRQPTDDRVAAVRAHVLAARPRGRRVVRRFAVALAALAVLAGGIVIGYNPPDWVRDGARAIGLRFVDSPELVDARAEMLRLGRAVSRKDGAAIIAGDNSMLGLVKKLDADEKNEIVPIAHEVHLRAIMVLKELGLCTADGPCPPPSG